MLRSARFKSTMTLPSTFAYTAYTQDMQRQPSRAQQQPSSRRHGRAQRHPAIANEADQLRAAASACLSACQRLRAPAPRNCLIDR